MSFWDGFIGSINTRRAEELERQRRNEDASRELEGKVAMRLLEDDDPAIQEHGLRILQGSMTPSKKKGGFPGFMGNLEERGGLRSLLDLARSVTGQDRPGQLQEPPADAGSAELPATSPTQPQKPQPSMLQKAVQGGVTFGAPSPGRPIGGATPPDFDEAGAASAPEVPGQASFGGINFGEPGMGNASAQVPAINVSKIAARVSADRGQPQPGERARLFFPSAARLKGQLLKTEFQTMAEQLQALGATPAETRRALMAKMGASGGQPNVTAAGYAKLADGRAVQTFTYEEAGVPPQIVIAGPNGGFVPLPPDAQATRMGAGAMGSQTSRMTGQQAIDFGIATEEDGLDPSGYYSVKQVGDTIQILPATKPVDPFAIQRGPGAFTPGMDRLGNPVPVPQPIANPRVAAAKALVQAYRSIPSQMRMTQGQRQRAMSGLLQQYPSLSGLTPAQIEAIAQADDYLPDAQLDQMIKSLGGRPQSQLQGPGAAPADPNALPPDWASRIVEQLQKEQRGAALPAPPR